MISGIAIARTGKYKIFPLVGIVFIVAALVSLSFIVDADTSVWTLVPFMVLLGLGLGFNFQPVILAVQNAVPPREMGVATSSVTFFRQMGGTLGVGGLPVRSCSPRCRTRSATPYAAARRPRVQQAAAAHPEQLAAARRRQRPERHLVHPEAARARWPRRSRPASPTRSTWSSSSRPRVVAIGFFVLLFLPELPLRTQSGIQARQASAGRAGAAAGTGARGRRARRPVTPATAPPATARPDGRERRPPAPQRGRHRPRHGAAATPGQPPAGTCPSGDPAARGRSATRHRAHRSSRAACAAGLAHRAPCRPTTGPRERLAEPPPSNSSGTDVRPDTAVASWSPVRSSLILSRRDLDFLLHEWLDVEALTKRPRYAEHSRETFDAVLDLAEQIATEHFAPHNRKADENEPQLVDGTGRR